MPVPDPLQFSPSVLFDANQRSAVDFDQGVPAIDVGASIGSLTAHLLQRVVHLAPHPIELFAHVEKRLRPRLD